MFINTRQELVPSFELLDLRIELLVASVAALCIRHIDFHLFERVVEHLRILLHPGCVTLVSNGWQVLLLSADGSLVGDVF